MLKNLFLFAIILTILVFGGAAVVAQELEQAPSSTLTAVALPAGAARISPQSVPSEISQTLEKFVESGEGKLRQGGSEVLVWGGTDFKKSNAPVIINSLSQSLKGSGWQYEVSGEENGITVFSVVKDDQQRRAIIGFYGATDDALVLAWTELLKAGNSSSESAISQQKVQSETSEQQTASGGDSTALLGKWSTGNVSMLQEKNLTTGQITSSNGSLRSYKFYADGRFEHIGYMKSTMYGCTTDLFNDKRGKYVVNGSQITFIPSKNYWKNTYSCAPGSNKERDYVLDRETFTWRTKTDEYNKSYICLTDAKNSESCFRRED